MSPIRSIVVTHKQFLNICYFIIYYFKVQELNKTKYKVSSTNDHAKLICNHTSTSIITITYNICTVLTFYLISFVKLKSMNVSKLSRQE